VTVECWSMFSITVKINETFISLHSRRDCSVGMCQSLDITLDRSARFCGEVCTNGNC